MTCFPADAAPAFPTVTAGTTTGTTGMLPFDLRDQCFDAPGSRRSDNQQNHNRFHPKFLSGTR